MIFSEYFGAWKKYLDSDGRARRREFLVFCGVNLGILAFCIYLSYKTEILFAALFIIAAAMPTLTVTIRRLHDTGHSARKLLRGFDYYLGDDGHWTLFLFHDSERADNEYGPSPKYKDQSVSG